MSIKINQSSETHKTIFPVKEKPAVLAREVHEKMLNLVRFAMSHPSQSTKQLVREGLTHFGHLITRHSLTVEDMQFFIDGAPESRSEYTKIHTPGNHERRAKLRDLIYTLVHFNRVRDFDAHFDKYVGDLEALSSGLGYRAVRAAAGKDKAESSAAVKRLLDDMNKKGYMPSHILTEFPHRQSENVSGPTDQLAIDILRGIQDPVDGGLPGPQPGLAARRFTMDSYVAKALSKNIPMRAHVSSSAGVTLAGLQYLKDDGKNKKPFNEYELLQLGGIVAGTYAMADFHSLAESAAGVAHFYQLNSNMRFCKENLEEIKPKTFHALSFGMLNSIVARDALPQFNVLTQDLIEDYIEDAPVK